MTMEKVNIEYFDTKMYIHITKVTAPYGTGDTPVGYVKKNGSIIKNYYSDALLINLDHPDGNILMPFVKKGDFFTFSYFADILEAIKNANRLLGG